MLITTNLQQICQTAPLAARKSTQRIHSPVCGPGLDGPAVSGLDGLAVLTFRVKEKSYPVEG